MHNPRKHYLQTLKYHIDLNYKYLELIKIFSKHVLKALWKNCALDWPKAIPPYFLVVIQALSLYNQWKAKPHSRPQAGFFGHKRGHLWALLSQTRLAAGSLGSLLVNTPTRTQRLHPSFSSFTLELWLWGIGHLGFPKTKPQAQKTFLQLILCMYHKRLTH